MRKKTDYVTLFWKRVVQINGWAFLLTLLQAIIAWDATIAMISFRFALASFILHLMKNVAETLD